MVKEIAGYITGMINIYNNRLDRIQKKNYISRKLTESFLIDLYDLLDFVEDIPEKESNKDTQPNMCSKEDLLRLRIVVAEITNENLEKKNKELKKQVDLWRSTCEGLKNHIKGLEGIKNE